MNIYIKRKPVQTSLEVKRFICELKNNKFQLIQYLIAQKILIMEGNTEQEVNETTNEKLDIVEEQMTEKHLSDDMILNLVNTESEENNLVKKMSLQDVERYIQTLEDFAYQELNDLTIECGKVHEVC